jgi:hypothetical protein
MTILFWIIAILASLFLGYVIGFYFGHVRGWFDGMEEAERMLYEKIDEMKESENKHI